MIKEILAQIFSGIALAFVVIPIVEAEKLISRIIAKRK
mgnify:CR=1 FL=1